MCLAGKNPLILSLSQEHRLRLLNPFGKSCIKLNISLGIFLIISSKISNPHFTIELKRKCQRVVNFKHVPGPSSISPYEINGQEMTVIWLHINTTRYYSVNKFQCIKRLTFCCVFCHFTSLEVHILRVHYRYQTRIFKHNLLNIDGSPTCFSSTASWSRVLFIFWICMAYKSLQKVTLFFVYCHEIYLMRLSNVNKEGIDNDK